MTGLKKALSIVLCLSMLLGTLTIGLLFASADDADYSVPTYAELSAKAQEAGTDFFYSGMEIYEGDELTDGIIPAGGTVHVKFYVKTNRDLYQGKYFVALSDSELFATASKDVISNVESKFAVSNTQNVAVTKSNAKTAGFIKTVNRIDTSMLDGYSVSDIEKWLVIFVNDKVKAKKDISADDPLVEFDLTFLEGKTGAIDIRMFEQGFTASGNCTTSGEQYIDGSAAANKVAVTGFELQGPLDITVANEIKFVNEDGSVIETQYPAEGDKITPPTVDNLFKWADADGKFVDLSNLKMGTEPATYTAILNSREVSVTLDAAGGTIDGAETKEITAAIGDGIDLEQYSPVKEGDTFKGWAVNGLLTKKYDFTGTDPVTATAVWANSATVKIYLGNMDNEWVEFSEYAGVPGEPIPAEDAENLVSAVKAKFEAEGKETMGATEDVTFESVSYFVGENASDMYLEPLTAANSSNVIVGEDNLYIVASFNQTVEYKFPVLNDNNEIVEGSWETYNTVNYKFETFEKVTENAETGDLDISFSFYDIRNMIAYEEGKIGEGRVQASSIRKFEDDEDLKYIYSDTIKNGKGEELTASQGYVSIYESGCTEPGYYEIYTYGSERTYKVGFLAKKSESDDVRFQVIDKEFKLGDTVSAADLQNFYVLNTPTTKYTLDEVKNDGKVVDLPGYGLSDIWYGSKENSLLGDYTVTLDKEFIDSNLKIYSSTKVVEISATFVPKEYEFTVMYKKPDGQWAELTTKKFSGDTAITYSSLIDADLEKIINDNLADGEILDKSAFTVEGYDTPVSRFRPYDGPLTVYVMYGSAERWAYVDYANGKTEAGAGYQRFAALYGTVIYDPNYVDEGEASADGTASKKPIFNVWLDSSNSAPVSKTVKTQETDDKGNPVYEPVYVDVLDEEGNPVIDEITGKVKQEVKKDDEGKIVYDKSKPVYDDPKGSVVTRPYRSCEMVGTKVYHLDHPVKEWADMPTQDQWIEGYENDKYTLCNTTIMQVQWKADNEFFFRVYDTDGFGFNIEDGFKINMNGNIYSALGKDFKWYYWKGDRPCKKGEGNLNTNPEKIIIVLLWPTKETLELANGETATGWYLTALPLSASFFRPSFIPELIPTIINLLKGLLF